MTFRLLLVSATCVALATGASMGHHRRKNNRGGQLDWPEFFDFDSFESTRYRPNDESDDAQYREPNFHHPNHRPEYAPLEPYRPYEEQQEPRQQDPFTKEVPAWLQELNELNNRPPSYPSESYSEEPQRATEEPIRTTSTPHSIQDKLPPAKKIKKIPASTQRPIVVEVAQSLPPRVNPQRIITNKPAFEKPTSIQQPINVPGLPVVPVSTPLTLHRPNAGGRSPTLYLPLPGPVPAAPAVDPANAKKQQVPKQLEPTPVYHPINPIVPAIPALQPQGTQPAPVHPQSIVQVKTAHRLEPKRTMKNGFKMLMGKTPEYETLEEHMKRRHESLSAKIADGLYSYARADWIKQRIPSLRKSEAGA